MAVYIGDDVTLKVGDGAGPEVFTTIGQVTNFSAPTRLLNTVTNYFLGNDEPTITPTTYDFGQCTFSLVFDPDNAQYTGLATDRDAKTNRNFKIVVTGATADELLFSGYVLSISQSGDAEGVMTGEAQIQITSITEWA